MVVFITQRAATAYTHFVAEHPIYFDGSKADITLVPTPTWPIPPGLYHSLTQYSKTRCLEVHNYPTKVSPSDVKSDISPSPVMKWTALEHKQLKGNVLSLRFFAIKFAKQAAAVFTSNPRYHGCRLRWVTDPCSQDLKTLLEPTTETKRVLPTPFNVDEPSFSVSKLLGIEDVPMEKDPRLEKVDDEDEAEVQKGRGFGKDAGKEEDNDEDKNEENHDCKEGDDDEGKKKNDDGEEDIDDGTKEDTDDGKKSAFCANA